MSCKHMNFTVLTRVNRLTDMSGDTVRDFAMDIRVECADCGLPFRFRGLPFGFDRSQPTLSVDSQELRVPIEPAHVTEILGQPLVSGTA